MDILLIHLLNSLLYASVLFLIAGGLSLIYGVMRIVNLAHGSYFMLGAYLGVAILRATNSFVLAIVGAVGATLVAGLFMQRLFLQRFTGRVLSQVLLTMGFLLLIADLSLWVWGGTPQIMETPRLLAGSIRLGTIVFPTYRGFVMVVGLVLAGVYVGQRDRVEHRERPERLERSERPERSERSERSERL